MGKHTARSRPQLFLTLLPHNATRFAMHGRTDRNVVEDIVRYIPPNARTWDPEGRVWLFDYEVHEEVCQLLEASGVTLLDNAGPLG